MTLALASWRAASTFFVCSSSSWVLASASLAAASALSLASSASRVLASDSALADAAAASSSAALAVAASAAFLSFSTFLTVASWEILAFRRGSGSSCLSWASSAAALFLCRIRCEDSKKFGYLATTVAAESLDLFSKVETWFLYVSSCLWSSSSAALWSASAFLTASSAFCWASRAYW